MTYMIKTGHWISHFGIKKPSNYKADTKKRCQEIMLSDWKIQLKKVQLTRDLKDYTIFYQGIRLPCKIDQDFRDLFTRIQATLVWFPENTCTLFPFAKIHARMINFHQKYFIESIPFENVNPDRIRFNSQKDKNIDDIENKLTRFQFYPGTEVACKYPKSLFKTQLPNTKKVLTWKQENYLLTHHNHIKTTKMKHLKSR